MAKLHFSHTSLREQDIRNVQYAANDEHDYSQEDSLSEKKEHTLLSDWDARMKYYAKNTARSHYLS